MSGILVAESCVEEWNRMKLGHQYNFIIFRVENYQQIVVCECGKANYDDFKSKFDTRECRYAVVEVPGTTKIAFISWTPDTASVKDRMTYASSRQALLDKLRGYTRAIQASDMADIDEKHVKSVFSST